MPLPALALPALGPMLKTLGIGAGFLGGSELLNYLLEHAGSGDLEKEAQKRLMSEDEAVRMADLLESQEMETGLELDTMKRESTEGLGASEMDFLSSLLLGANPATGGGPEAVVQSLEGVQPGLAARIARGSRVPVSPMAHSMGYTPGEVY